MITGTTGKKERNKVDLKANSFLSGDLTTKRRRNTSLQFAGIQSTRIYSLFPWEAMIFQSRKQVKF